MRIRNLAASALLAGTVLMRAGACWAQQASPPPLQLEQETTLDQVLHPEEKFGEVKAGHIYATRWHHEPTGDVCDFFPVGGVPNRDGIPVPIQEFKVWGQPMSSDTLIQGAPEYNKACLASTKSGHGIFIADNKGHLTQMEGL